MSKSFIVLLFFFKSQLLLGQVIKMPDALCGINNKNSLEDCKRVQQTILNLQASNRLNFLQKDIDSAKNMKLLQPLAPTSIRFAWPLTSRNAEKYAYLASKNFVDMDTSACGIRDYNGGVHTYNGHNGMDVALSVYHWELFKNNEVYAVAAAPGIIVGKMDGEFDRNCSWDDPPWQGTSGSGNYIAVLHADGQTVSYYKHLKSGTLTNKDSGDRVETGEYLGVVGSSGRSTAPHLHFEVHVGWGDPDNASGKLIEPFAGPYNPDTNVSLWVNQPPYEEPAVLGVESHDYYIQDKYSNSCDSTIDLSTLSRKISPGKSVYLRAYFRDWADGSTITFSLVRPDGSIETPWSSINNGEEYTEICNSSYGPTKYRFSYYTLLKTFPANESFGTWAFRFSYYGKIYSHYFSVGCISSQDFSGTQSGLLGFLVSNTITSTVTISGSSTNVIEYSADNQVVLSPGFVATAGCEFVANTKGCNTGN